MGKWFNKHIRKHFWWRLWYKKEKIQPGNYSAITSKCVQCHAQYRVNKSDYHPICTDKNNVCPCKAYEILKSK